MLDEHDTGWYRCVAFAPSGNTAIRISDVTIEGLDLRVNEVSNYLLKLQFLYYFLCA